MKGVSSRERKGVIYWYAQINGKKKYCGKGPEGKKLAEAARGKFLAGKYEKRELSAGLIVKKPKLKSFLDLANWYMLRPQTQRLRSYRQKLCLVGNLHKFFGKMLLVQIDTDLLEDYREFRIREGIKDSTANDEISLLRTMYHLARKRKKIPRELMPGEFPQIRDNSPPRRTITEIEFEKLLEYADKDFGDFLICGYETSMRSAEIGDLRRSQVHLDVPHISGAMLDYIQIADCKNGMPKTPPVSPRLKKILLRRLEGLGTNDRVFVHSGKPYYSGRVSYFMRKYCERAGVPHGDKLLDEDGNRIGVVFHSLRHTRVSKWVEAGWSDQVIMKASGHKTLAVYRNYVHLDASVVMRLVSETDKTGTKTLQTRTTG